MKLLYEVSRVQSHNDPVAVIRSVSIDVSVVICTRNRGELVRDTLESVLANDTVIPFEVIVVDQSDDDRTSSAVGCFLSDPRFRYIRADSVGLSRARNVGIRCARGTAILMTDDDCQASPDWIDTMTRALYAYPNVGVVFCHVEAVPCDLDRGWTPGFPCLSERLIRTWRDCRAPHGMGAGMAVKKSVVETIGGFDEQLGAGAVFQTYEDIDLALRALLAGHEIYQTSRTSIRHAGFRDRETGRARLRADYYAMGAGHAKLIRCAGLSAVPILALDFWHLICVPALRHIVRLSKPPVFDRCINLARGFVRGWRMPANRQMSVFADSRPAPEPAKRPHHNTTQ